MTPPFVVLATPRFERLLRRLTSGHPDLVESYTAALTILGGDPYHRTRQHHIIKLEGVPHGAGQYRLRLRRWRFRYDIVGQEVVLHSCSLRREDTYR